MLIDCSLTDEELKAKLDAIDAGCASIQSFLDRHQSALCEVGKFINRYAQHSRDCAVVGVDHGTRPCDCGFCTRLEIIWRLIPELIAPTYDQFLSS